MNTPPRPKVATISAALAAAFVLSASAAPGDPSAAPAPYTLFMGADISVGVKSVPYPVWDVSGSSWVVKVGGQPVIVSTKDGPVDLKLTPGLKLTEVSAQLANLKSEPSYTPGNDPYTKFTRSTNEAASQFAQSQYAANAANGQLDAASVLEEHVNTGSSGTGQAGTIASASSLPALAAASMANANNQVNASTAAMGASPGLAVGAGTNPDTEQFDALDISFEISAPRALEHPYVVAVSRYHERGAPEGTVRNWIYAQALERVDSKTRTIRFLAGGFKPGFQLKSFEVHLYNDGNEVATNLSSKRVPLSREDAFEYVKMEYVGSHKGATLPAAPAMGELPADLPSRIALGQMNHAFYVKVSKDGVGGPAFLDETCSQKADPYVDSVVAKLLFKPALKDGKPVDGIAVVDLGHLAM